MSIELKCSIHPRYLALFPPKPSKKSGRACSECDVLYNTARQLSPYENYPPDGAIIGRFYCNPFHCGRYWKNIEERNEHLDQAYERILI